MSYTYKTVVKTLRPSGIAVKFLAAQVIFHRSFIPRHRQLRGQYFIGEKTGGIICESTAIKVKLAVTTKMIRNVILNFTFVLFLCSKCWC